MPSNGIWDFHGVVWENIDDYIDPVVKQCKRPHCQTHCLPLPIVGVFDIVSGTEETACVEHMFSYIQGCAPPISSETHPFWLDGQDPLKHYLAVPHGSVIDTKMHVLGNSAWHKYQWLIYMAVHPPVEQPAAIFADWLCKAIPQKNWWTRLVASLREMLETKQRIFAGSHGTAPSAVPLNADWESSVLADWTSTQGCSTENSITLPVTAQGLMSILRTYKAKDVQ